MCHSMNHTVTEFRAGRDAMWAESQQREYRARSPLSFNVRRLQPMPKGKAVPRLRDLGYQVLDESVGAHRIQHSSATQKSPDTPPAAALFAPASKAWPLRGRRVSDYGA